MGTSQIKIFLNESRDANVFKEESAVHQSDIEDALRYIREILKEIQRHKKNKINERFERFHSHKTISIFGRRGTGKTSFLLTLLHRIREDGKPGRIYPLNPIDPNMIEGPEIFLATVVTAINKEVLKNRKNKDSCFPEAIAKKLMELARAFRVLAPTNASGDWGKWLGNISDPEVFAREVLVDADSGIHLAERVDEYLEACCAELGVDAILLPFDDVDTDLRYGWQVLETLRRYLASPYLVPIISGDLTLYRMLVRVNQWPALKDLVAFEKDHPGRYEEFVSQINQLEEQYLKKLLPSTYRIHLGALNEQIWWAAAQDRHDYIRLYWEGDDTKNNLDLPLSEVFKRFCEDVFFYPTEGLKPGEKMLERAAIQVLDPCKSPTAKLFPSNTRNVVRFLETLKPWAKKNYSDGKQNSNERYDAQDIKIKNLMRVASPFNHILSEYGIRISDLKRLAKGGQISWLAMTILRLRERKITLWRLEPNFTGEEKGEHLNQLALLLKAFIHCDWERSGVPLEYCIKVLSTNMAASRLNLKKEEVNAFAHYLNLNKEEYSTETASRLLAYKISLEYRKADEMKASTNSQKTGECPTYMAGVVRLNGKFNPNVANSTLKIYLNLPSEGNGFMSWIKQYINSHQGAIPSFPIISTEKGGVWGYLPAESGTILQCFLQNQPIDEFGTTEYFASFYAGLATLSDILKAGEQLPEHEQRNAIKQVISKIQHCAWERTAPYEVRAKPSHSSINQNNNNIDVETPYFNISDEWVSALFEWITLLKNAKSESMLPISVFTDIWVRFDNLLQGIANDLSGSIQSLGEILERWIWAWFYSVLIEEFHYRYEATPGSEPQAEKLVHAHRGVTNGDMRAYFSKLRGIDKFDEILPYTHAMISCPIFLACLPRDEGKKILSWFKFEQDKPIFKFLLKVYADVQKPSGSEKSNFDFFTALCSLTPYVEPDQSQSIDAFEFKEAWNKFVSSLPPVQSQPVAEKFVSPATKDSVPPHNVNTSRVPPNAKPQITLGRPQTKRNK